MELKAPVHELFSTVSTFEAVHVVPKLWGCEYWLTNEPKYCAKILRIDPGYECSLHYHTYKTETFIVLRGEMKLESQVPDQTLIEETIRRGHKRTIGPGVLHRFSATHGAIVLEVSTQHNDEDVTRIVESRAIHVEDDHRNMEVS